MNDTKKANKSFIEIIKLIPSLYFMCCEFVLDILQTGLKYALLGIKKGIIYLISHIGLFFKKANEITVVHYIFIPFIFIAKGIAFIFSFIHKITKKFKDSLTMNQKKALTGWGFLTPWLIGFGGLVLYPVGLLIFRSFNDVKQIGDQYNYSWVGFDNYRRILRVDIDFMMDVQDFIVRVLLYTPVIIALAVVIAMLLNQNIKGKGFFRMVFFLPIIILNGELLSTMSDNGGMDIHISPFVFDMLTAVVPVFAIDLFTDLFSIIIEILWYTGVPILIFLSMLQKIDRSLYEAASIDGANAWSIFWKITLPIIRPAISVAVIFIVVFLANFDGNPINALIVSSDGDPSRYPGYAAAMALIYSVIQIAVIVVLLLITRERKSKGRA